MKMTLEMNEEIAGCVTVNHTEDYMIGLNAVFANFVLHSTTREDILEYREKLIQAIKDDSVWMDLALGYKEENDIHEAMNNWRHDYFWDLIDARLQQCFLGDANERITAVYNKYVAPSEDFRKDYKEDAR